MFTATAYTWGMTSSPYTMNGTIVTTFLATLNAGGGFAGHTDWRIPNVNELQSIVNYQNLSPAVDTAFNTSCAAGCTVLTCSCTQSFFFGDYWPSTTYQDFPGYAWYVSFFSGYVDSSNGGKSNSYSVRAVRGGSSQLLRTGQTSDYGPGSDGNLQEGAARSYTDNGDGTITDNTTGLMWEKKDQSGGIHDCGNTYTWGMTSSPYTMNGTMVTTFLATLNAGGGFAGHTDWRIPNVNELLSLANYQNYEPAAVDAVFNTSCAASCTVLTCSCPFGTNWSSTTYQNGANDAWSVAYGSAFNALKSYYASVRAVRGGTPAPTFGACPVVGTGTSGSCTEAALDWCLPGGGGFMGSATFNCGGATTITVTSTKTISADTTIDGGSLITISGGNSVGVFSVSTGVKFTVQNLTVATGNNRASGHTGGGIENYGTLLTVTNSTFTGNTATGNGGGIFNPYGTVTVTNSTFSGNSSNAGGGGIEQLRHADGHQQHLLRQ